MKSLKSEMMRLKKLLNDGVCPKCGHWLTNYKILGWFVCKGCGKIVVSELRKYDFDKLDNRLVEAEHHRDERIAILYDENHAEE